MTGNRIRSTVRRRRPISIIAAAVAGIWVIVAGVTWAARAAETTPADVRAFLDGADPAAPGFVDDLSRRVNRLPPGSRFDDGLGRDLRDAFAAMDADQRAAYLDATLPRGFDQMMEAINAMPGDERRKLVDGALARLEEDLGQDRPEELDDASLSKIVDEGMKSYLSDTSAEAKLDLQPLVAKMQEVLRAPPRRGPFSR